MLLMELLSMLDQLLHRIEVRRRRIGVGTETSEAGKDDGEP